MVCKICSKRPVITISGVKLCKDCFIDYFERKVKRTIRQYKLIDKKDSILVAASGGKDSTTALYILNQLAKQRRQKIAAFTIDLGIGDYSKKNLSNLRKFCKKEKIKLYEFSLRDEFGYSLCYIKSILASKGVKLKSCTICGVLRRHMLNKLARKLKFTKVATGHNLDDEAQTILMNQFKGNIWLSAKLGPIGGAVKSKSFVPRIKPLYFCSEKEITLYSKLKKFPVQYRRCPCSVDAYRAKVRAMLKEFEEKYPGTLNGIINSFLEIIPYLRQKQKGEVGLCERCGEPSMQKLCKACEIIEKLR